MPSKPYLLLTLAACYAGPAIPPRLGKVIELPSVGEAGATRRRESPSFGELTTAKGPKRPRTCVEWETMHAAHAEPTNGVEEAADEVARLRCDALEWLTRARPSARSFVTAWDPSVVLPESIAQGEAHWDDDTLTLRRPDSTTKVVVRPIAWGDFNGDTVEDLLLAVSTLDTEGPMVEHRVLALTRDDAQQPLRVVQR